MHNSNRGGVVNHALEISRQTHPLAQPIDHQSFEFGRGGGSAPCHRVHVQRRGEHFAEDSRRGRGPAEVSKKHGMAPMHHSRKDDPIDICQNFLEWLALLGWLRWQRGTNCTRFAVRRNAQRFYFSTIIRDPIRHAMKLFAENLRRSVSEFVVSILHSEIILTPHFVSVFFFSVGWSIRASASDLSTPHLSPLLDRGGEETLAATAAKHTPCFSEVPAAS